MHCEILNSYIEGNMAVVSNSAQEELNATTFFNSLFIRGAFRD